MRITISILWLFYIYNILIKYDGFFYLLIELCTAAWLHWSIVKCTSPPDVKSVQELSDIENIEVYAEIPWKLQIVVILLLFLDLQGEQLDQYGLNLNNS